MCFFWKDIEKILFIEMEFYRGKGRWLKFLRSSLELVFGIFGCNLKDECWYIRFEEK